MHLKELVEHIIRFEKDKDMSEVSIIEMYTKQIKHDVMSAFQMSKPLIEKNFDLFLKKPSFLSFLFELIDIDISYDVNMKGSLDLLNKKVDIENKLDLKQELDKLKNLHERCQSEIQNKTESFDVETKTLKAQIENYKLEIQNKNEETKKLKKQIENYKLEMQNKNESFDAETKKLKEQIDKLKSDLLQQEQKKIDELKKECEKEKSQLKEDYDKKMQNADSEITKLQKNISDLKDNHKKELESAKREAIQRQQDELEAKNNQIELHSIMQEQLTQLKNFFENKIRDINAQAEKQSILNKFEDLSKQINELSLPTKSQSVENMHSWQSDIYVKEFIDNLLQFSQKMNIYTIPELEDPRVHLNELLQTLIYQYMTLLNFVSNIFHQHNAVFKTLQPQLISSNVNLPLSRENISSIQYPNSTMPIFSIEDVTASRNIETETSKLNQELEQCQSKIKELNKKLEIINDIDIKKILKLLENDSNSTRDTQFYVDSINSLKYENKQLQKQSEKQKAQIDELEKNYTKEKNELKNFKKKKDEIYKKFEEKSKQLKDDLDKCRLNLNEETTKLDKCQQEKSQCEKELKLTTNNMNSQLQILTNKNNELQEMLEKYQQEKLDYERELQSINDVNMDNNDLKSKSDPNEVNMNVDKSDLTLQEELHCADYKNKKYKITNVKPKFKGSQYKSAKTVIEKLNQRIKALEDEKNNLSFVNDNIQKDCNNELQKLREELNEEKSKNQNLNTQFLETLNLKDTKIKSLEDTINDQYNQLQQLKESHEETLAENKRLISENKTLESDLAQFEKMNVEKDKEICELNSIISKTKSFKRKRSKHKPKSSKKMFEFSYPIQYDNTFETDEEEYQDDDLNEGKENLYMTSTPETNIEEILSRCIREKDKVIYELEEYKQKYANLIKDAEYVTTYSQSAKLTEKNFKLLFIGFFKYHFKKLLNPNRINLDEDDKKLLNNLKFLLENISKSNKDDYFDILATYVNQQINSLIGSFSEIEDNEANTVQTFLQHTLNEIEEYIKHIKITQEFENLFEIEFSPYTLSNAITYESIANIKNILKYLQEIFNVQFIRQMEIKLLHVLKLINQLYPKYTDLIYEVNRENFLEHLIQESITTLDSKAF